MKVLIRRAEKKDGEAMLRMLKQIGKLHEEGRPDLFYKNACKFDLETIYEMVQSEDICFVAEVDGSAQAYAICKEKELVNHPTLQDARLLYIDDFCVDETCRGENVGTQLMEYVIQFAKEAGFVRVELNVWGFNERAKKFYEKCGFGVQRMEMEISL